MLKSMTGYGVAQGILGSRRVTVETKSVNHKFCEVNLRLSSRFLTLEGPISEYAKSFFSRGRIDVLVKDEAGQSHPIPARIDLPKLKAYLKTIQNAGKALGITSQPSWDLLLGLPQVLVTEDEEDLKKLWLSLKPLLAKSFEALEKMRIKEGKGIEGFFRKETEDLGKEIKSIQQLIPKNVEYHRIQLAERISKLTHGMEIDGQRLAQEIAYFVDRSDISEEIQRLAHHLVHFREILKGSEPTGRRLDFLLQEMNREVNTLSAKVQNAHISQRVVDCKHSIEKMREQVQNVE